MMDGEEGLNSYVPWLGDAISLRFALSRSEKMKPKHQGKSALGKVFRVSF